MISGPGVVADGTGRRCTEALWPRLEVSYALPSAVRVPTLAGVRMSYTPSVRNRVSVVPVVSRSITTSPACPHALFTVFLPVWRTLRGRWEQTCAHGGSTKAHRQAHPPQITPLRGRPTLSTFLKSTSRRMPRECRLGSAPPFPGAGCLASGAVRLAFEDPLMVCGTNVRCLIVYI